MLTEKQLKIIVWTIFGALILVAAGFLLTNYSRLVSALAPRPEPFTELYFENHLDLPEIYYLDKPLEFAFTIRNLEHQPVTYQVDVTAEDASQSAEVHSLYSITVPLNHDEMRTIPITAALPEFSSKEAKVVVTLSEQDQTIHFFINQFLPPSPAPLP